MAQTLTITASPRHPFAVSQTNQRFEPSEKSWKFADKQLKKMSVDEKVGQLVHVGINARVAPDTWDKAVADFVERVRAGRIAEGFLAVVEVVEARLAEHFPRPPDDRDELPNRVVEI